MKSPAELFVESLTEWPEPMVSTNLTSDDWCDVASIFSNTRIDNVGDNVGLSIIGAIESQSLTIENFKGNEGLFMFAFNTMMSTHDIERIKKFHKMHGKSIVDWISSNPDNQKQTDFFQNIFTPKEA